MSTQLQKPINTLYGFHQAHKRVVVWMQHDNHTRIEGVLVGYDEFLNLVLEDAVEHDTRKGDAEAGFPCGKLLLKGDNVGLIHAVGSA
jgi:small nuclear ribonucleoprotein E